MRETPWGYITYLDYRYKVEFGLEQYREIDRYCKEKGIDWMVSVWDEQSVDFMEQFDTPAYKVPSASLTDHNLLKYTRKTGKPLIISTGMSTMKQIHKAVSVIGSENLAIMHCTSTYPCEPEELNLRMIETLRKEFPHNPIGYSGHEVGLVPSAIAVAFGACMVERHLPSTAPCGVRTKPPRWSPAALSAWSNTSASPKPAWAMASSACTTANCPR
jgi:N-acetylneuraminate synthase